MECEVMSKTYKQIQVVPGAEKVIGEVELNQKVHGFYISAFTAAMLALNENATLITEAEIVKVTKLSGQTWVAGDWIYWDESNSRFTNIGAEDLFCVGKAQKAAGDTAVIGFIQMQDNYHPIQIGTAAVPVAIVAANPLAVIQATSAAAAGNVELMKLGLVMTGASVSTGAKMVRWDLTSNVKIGNVANIYSKVNFQTNGCVQGLAAAICGELMMGSGAITSGSYCVLELELGAYGNYCNNQRTSFMVMNRWGSVAGKASFDAEGYLFDINVGAAGATKIYNAEGDKAGTGGLKFKLNGADHWFLIANTAP